MLASVASILCGCGASAELATSREAANAAADKGQSAFASRDYATAADQLAIAVNSGVLNPDAYAAAAVKLAMAYAALSRFDEANALLEQLLQGAPNLDEIYAARSFVLKKQGKMAEANAAMAQARRYNRTIKEFQ